MGYRSMGDVLPDEVEIRTHGGMDYVILRENIEAAEEGWEYDENQFTVPHGLLDLDDVRANPGKYMEYSYQPPHRMSAEERIAALESENSDLKAQVAETQDALVELAGIIAEGM